MYVCFLILLFLSFHVLLFVFESIFACVFASGLVFPAVAPHFHDWGICHFALPTSTSGGVTTFKIFAFLLWITFQPLVRIFETLRQEGSKVNVRFFKENVRK